MVVYDNIGVHGTGREMNVEEFWVPARGSTTRNRAQSRALKSSGSTSSTTSSLVPGKAENQGALAEEAGISGSVRMIDPRCSQALRTVLIKCLLKSRTNSLFSRNITEPPESVRMRRFSKLKRINRDVVLGK